MSQTNKNIEVLYHAISEIRPEYLDEADSYIPKAIFYWKKWITIAACICICFCSAIPVLAATNNDFAYQILYSISPTIAQTLKPINIIYTDNGIEMKVIAANIEDSNATIYISMQDVISDRLDETADLFDSYSIHTPYDQIGHCTFIDYNTETKTALFMITIEQINDVLIPGDKITFSVNRLLSKKEHELVALKEIDTECIPLINDYVIHPDIRGWGGQNATSIDRKHLKLLNPASTSDTVIIDGVTLTGYGMIDNRLHVQIRYDNLQKTDNHGDIYLKKQSGDIIHCQSNIAFWDDYRTDSYEEYIFPISAEELKDYEIWGEFWTCNEGTIEGNWQITFPLTAN